MFERSLFKTAIGHGRKVLFFGFVPAGSQVPNPAGLQLHAIELGGLQAVCAQIKGDWRRPEAHKLLHRQKLHHQWLEGLMLAGAPVLSPRLPVPLPVKHCETGLHQAMAGNQSLLADALERLGQLRQYEMLVTVDPKTHAQQLAANGAFAGLDGRPAEQVAAAMAAILRHERDQLARQLDQGLAPALLAIKNQQTQQDDLVWHAYGLFTNAQEAVFDAALERLDGQLEQAWPGLLTLRLTGPLPAIDWHGLQLHWVPQSALVDACRRLGLEPAADAVPVQTIQDAFRRQAKRLHPDLAACADAADRAADLAALSEARDLLLRFKGARPDAAFSDWLQLEINPPRLGELHNQTHGTAQRMDKELIPA